MTYIIDNTLFEIIDAAPNEFWPHRFRYLRGPGSTYVTDSKWINLTYARPKKTLQEAKDAIERDAADYANGDAV